MRLLAEFIYLYICMHILQIKLIRLAEHEKHGGAASIVYSNPNDVKSLRVCIYIWPGDQPSVTLRIHATDSARAAGSMDLERSLSG
jgi:hypothetical protein